MSGEFLTSHRAHAAATREFGRVTAALVEAIKHVARSRGEQPPEVRLAPDRCIVQLGPLALTVTHLKTASAQQAGGQVLAILWQGQIAVRGDHVPERANARVVPPPPVSVWEESYDPEAASEASWHWCPLSAHERRLTSVELAGQCEAAVRAALGGPDHLTTAAPPPDSLIP